jgi:hypothetical protein
MRQSDLTSRVMAIIVAVLHKRLPVTRLPDEVTFHDICLNPFERVYIADEIEREWQIALAEDEINGWQSVEDVVMSIRSRMWP